MRSFPLSLALIALTAPTDLEIARRKAVDKAVDAAMAKATTTAQATDVIEAITWLREQSSPAESLLSLAKLDELEKRAQAVGQQLSEDANALKAALATWNADQNNFAVAQTVKSRLAAVRRASPRYIVGRLGLTNEVIARLNAVRPTANV